MIGRVVEWSSIDEFVKSRIHQVSGVKHLTLNTFRKKCFSDFLRVHQYWLMQ